MKISIFLIKNILFIGIIFLPIFVSFGGENLVSISRIPEEEGFYFTIPISAIFILISSGYYNRQLKFNLIHFSLLFIAIYITALGAIYDRPVFYLHGLGIAIFILANNFFKYYFDYLKKSNNLKYFNKCFNLFILIFIIMLIYSLYLMSFFLVDRDDEANKIYLINKNLIVFNWANFFSGSLLVILAFLVSYKKINYFLIFVFFIVVCYITYYSTSSISILILLLWIFTFFIHTNLIRRFIFNNYIYIFTFVTLLIVILSILLDYRGIESHNIRFRFQTLYYYIQNINLYELIIPISSPHYFNFSAHNQTFSFVMYGGLILVFLFYKNLKNLIDETPDTMKSFKYLLILFLIFGSQVQNYFTNPYICIIIAFFINYSIYLKKQN